MARKLVVGLVLAAVLAVGGCFAFTSHVAATKSTARHTMDLRISGTVQVADLTVTPSASTAPTPTHIAVPWHQTVTIIGALPQSYQFSAHATGPGTLSCTLTVDGRVIMHDVSHGTYPRVFCDYGTVVN